MIVPEPQNEELSQTAQSVLRCYNRLAEDDPQVKGLHRGLLRDFLLARLQTITDEHGKWLPSRASAEAFMAHFTEANREVSTRWLGGKQFDDSMESYPVEAIKPAVIADAEQQLEALIAEFRNGNRSRLA